MTGPVPFLFGGRACLDFTNTVNSRVAPPTRDYLPDYDALLGWCRQALVLSDGIIGSLRERALLHPAEADAAYGQAIVFREALFRLFRAVAAGEETDVADLAILNGQIKDASASRGLVAENGGFHWHWRTDAGDLALPLHAVALSAAELLTQGDLLRVRQCPPPEGCGWLFYDQTKNRSRRWCSMEHCGSAAKAKRFAEKRGRMT
jgi:predicted RNA-binding Zn ribbon-like protein